MRAPRAAALAGLFLILGTAPVAAQEEEDDDYGLATHRPFEFNVNAGGHKPDTGDSDAESDTDIGVGARMFYHPRSGMISFGGNFTYVISDVDLGGGESVDVNTYYYSGELEITFPSGMFQPFLGAGAGAQTVKVSDSGSGTLSRSPGLTPASTESSHSETNLYIPLVAGFRIMPGGGRFGLRVDLRDNVVRVSGDDELETESETFHNLELSGGISLFFGS